MPDRKKKRREHKQPEEMEKSKKRKNKKKTTMTIREYKTSSSTHLLNSNTVFPLLLATLCVNNHLLQHPPPNFRSFVKKCLNKLQSNSKPLPNSILSLLPILLSSKHPDTACRTAEIVGAASLLSFEMNERIALDGDIVKALVSCLASCSKSVSTAACNALLDLSTTSIGRHRLFEFSALDRLIICLLQNPIPLMSISLCTEVKRSVAYVRIAFKEDRLVVSLLNATISLINTSNMEQLEKVPKNRCAAFLEFLKKLWEKVHSHMSLDISLIPISDTNLCASNVTVNNLAESIFRLSANTDPFAPFPSVLVESRIFGSSNCSFETFMLHHWEVLPVIVKRPPLTSLSEVDEVFNPFTESLINTDSPFTFISPMLERFISCLPIASDELDILSFLEEVRNDLGCSIIYHQDIRVLRTEKESKREVHFFSESSDPCLIKNLHALSHSDIVRCEEAYRQGYTIALRGMEFRFTSIAAIADTIACLFGQPSVGANLYLTPPNSQGLACHYDDHCVFVCQLFGNKQWTIFSEPNLQLPRLYDPIDSHGNFDAESSSTERRKFFLGEGDVLYVPRGFAHEAHTDSMKSSELAGLSLHITFGIEVEPPFEWAGFAHVALHQWNKTQKQPHHASVEPLSGSLNAITVYLLHAMIDLIGASDPTFRKACLVGALLPALGRKDWLYSNQKSTFYYLISKISVESRFMEVLRFMETANAMKDLLQRIRWIQLLNKENDAAGACDTFMGIEKLMRIYFQQQDTAKAAFMQMKTNFCAEASFEDVIDSYIMLFEKYKKARKQYLNGMLSLHCH